MEKSKGGCSATAGSMGQPLYFWGGYDEIGNSTLDGTIDSIFTKTNPTDGVARGVITVRHCQFINCHFVRISFIGTEEVFGVLRRGIVNDSNH